MAIVPTDTNLIQVDISVLKTAPVKEDTTASLKLQGIAGGVYVELSGGNPAEENLAKTQEKGTTPEIHSIPSTITTVMDMIPDMANKITHIADQVDKLLSDKNIKEFSATLKNLHKSSDDC